MGTNIDPQIEQMEKYRLSHISAPYDVNDIRKAIPFAIKKLEIESYYGPLIERFPVLFDEQIPSRIKNGILDNDTCACTDGNNVYIMTDEMKKIFDLMYDEHRHEDTNKDLVSSIAGLLAHEYMHILCRHKDIIKTMNLKTNTEARCLQLACEIEANRGHMIDTKGIGWCREHSMFYKSSVTDDSIPETKKDKYLPEIYATLLEMAKEAEQRQKLEQLLKQIVAKDLEEGEGQDKGKEQKGNKNGNKGQVQGQPQTSSNKDNVDGDDTTVSSVDRQQNGEETKNDSEPEWEELTQEKIEEAIKNATETIKQVQGIDSGSENGIGLESYDVEYKPELTPQENLKRDYERWNEKQIKKELAKMKGLIRGKVSKNKEKTYARPTRRAISGSGTLIGKGVRYEKSYSPKVLIALDSSGSMCSTTMKEVACAIENIFKDLGKPKQGSYICKHESNVSDVKPMAKWKDVVESYCPCGGNCFTRVLEKANELGVDVVLNVGDGQDCIYRDYPQGVHKSINEFKAKNRLWFDVLVTDKNDNHYYAQEAYFDEQKGIHREAIKLGNKISKYIGK